MTDQTSSLPKARVKPASNWSAIWVLPIIALLIGGWLGWKAYSEAGVMIAIEFPSGDGLQACEGMFQTFVVLDVQNHTAHVRLVCNVG